ncbi:hypothetical protein PUNSTDRAFT_74840 [Punctularia strigosozonata HHB-11173 SS5]|uniref:uncharacterized protein n=1 Tax=Punctularia strigosozonata (strain HHB-11173) TaxID=741275 RepID=UPI00044174DD|nr:uncharacterized protein PUNSTDRAFT_74840 [Punctularia strigosozonata HHB-11173 SS5]EIN05453.1 hypothetical protein PUNSTDRAFT_74840 [Punctularia strigosozonata HHB-11173 SS5]
MSTNLLWPTKLFFYPVGNTAAICLTQDLPPGQAADVLLLGCGDPRNILYTLFADLKPDSQGDRQLDITCCDHEPAILARNIVLFTLITDGKESDFIFNIFYHIFIDDQSVDLLARRSRQLADASTSMEAWSKSEYGSYMHILASHTLSELHHLWSLYAGFVRLDSSRIATLRRDFKNLARRQESGVNMSALRSAGPVFMEAAEAVWEMEAQFWKTGTTFSSNEALDGAKNVNPLFAYSRQGETINPHYGTFPPQGFHLFDAFAPVSPSPNISWEKGDVRASILAQFRCWSDSFRARVQDKTSSKLFLRFYTGDALLFCRALEYRARTGDSTPALPVGLWSSGELILLADRSSTPSSPAFPCKFDVIDSSNLNDHLGLVNVLTVTQPLMKEDSGSKAVLYTETLLQHSDEPSVGLRNALGVDITAMALLVGLSPRPCLTGFSTQSCAHELLVHEFGEMLRTETQNRTSQFHERLVWVNPAHGDMSNAEIPTPCFSVIPLAQLLFEVYTNMFDNECLTSIMAARSRLALERLHRDHYGRHSFVTLLALLRRRLIIQDGTWGDVFGSLLNLVERDPHWWIRSSSYQELCLQLHLFGLYTVDPLTSRWRELAMSHPPMSLFKDWKDVGPVVCIALTVPRSALLPLIELGDSSPTIMVQLWSGMYVNAFLAINAVPGRIVDSPGGQHCAVIAEDPRGLKDASHVVFTFWAPTWIVVAAGLTVALCLKPNPIISVKFVKSLGIELELFSAPVNDSTHVRVLRNRPNCTNELEKVAVSARDHTRRASSYSIIVGMEQNEVKKLTGHIPISDVGVGQALGNGAIVAAKQQSPCTMMISVGVSDFSIKFPYPVDGSKMRLRVARKSRYVEVVVPPCGALGGGGYALNPFPVAGRTSWSVHQIALDRLTTLDVSNRKMLMPWLEQLLAVQLSNRERASESSPKTEAVASEVLGEVKTTINSFFAEYCGMKGPKRRVFAIADSEVGNLYMFVFVDRIRIDSAAFTVVIDGAILPVNRENAAGVLRAYGVFTRHPGSVTTRIHTSRAEEVMWRKMLPALVERCRTWEHGPNCEYIASGRIPLSDEPGGPTICNCGRDRHLPKGLQSQDNLRALLRHATRVAISPLYAMPYVEPVSVMRAGALQDARGTRDDACIACQGPGKPRLLICSRCKKVRYCSPECQRKDWKAGHKLLCESTK